MGAIIGYPVEVVQGERLATGRTAEDVLAQLVGGYGRLSAGAQRAARVRLANEARVPVQDLLNAGEAFLGCSAAEAVMLTGRALPAGVEVWSAPVPLVLVADPASLPLGALPQVSGAGQVWWVDPSTAQSLLLSLHEVRWLDLSVDFAAAADRAAWLSARQAFPNVGRQGAGGYRWRQDLSNEVAGVQAGTRA